MELTTRTTRGRPLEQLRRKEEQPKTFPKGRRCSVPSCITVLSVYDPGPKCFCHTPRSKLIKTLDEFDELMEAA